MQKRNEESEVTKNLIASIKEEYSIKSLINACYDNPIFRFNHEKIFDAVFYSMFFALKSFLEGERLNALEKELILSNFGYLGLFVKLADTNVKKSEEGIRVYQISKSTEYDFNEDYSDGVTLQIRHLSLNTSFINAYSTSIFCDHILIICKNSERKTIVRFLSQIGLKSRIQSIVTEDDLVRWYEKALRGSHAELLGNTLLETMRKELANEFPSIDETPEIIKRRKYETIKNMEWKERSI